MLRVMAQVIDFLGQLLDGEVGGEVADDSFGDGVGNAEFVHLAPEDRLVVGDGRDVLRRGDEAGGRIDGDLALAIDRCRCER